MKNLLKDKKWNILLTSALMLVAVVITVIMGIKFRSFSQYKVYFYQSDAVTRVEKFSDYSKKLKGTIGDSDIYVFEGTVSKEGPKLLILGGTHPNEPSGQLTSVLFLENMTVEYGTVYVVTEANRSAYSHSHPQEASPFYYNIETSSGKLRTFKFGSRATNTNEQWPNPDIYVNPAGARLTSNDTRNLNRSYPGSESGTYSERVAYAITQLIIKNNITITIDLHEASPEYVTINTIVYGTHTPDQIEAKEVGRLAPSSIAAKAQSLMEDVDVTISTEGSPTNLRGLSHRELSDWTNTLAFLCETSNASQGKLRGAFTEELIVDGSVDKFYQKALELEKKNNTEIIFGEPTTIAERVARHYLSIASIIDAYNTYAYRDARDAAGGILSEDEFIASSGELKITIKPGMSNDEIYQDILTKGVGSYLHDPE